MTVRFPRTPNVWQELLKVILSSREKPVRFGVLKCGTFQQQNRRFWIRQGAESHPFHRNALTVSGRWQ